MRIKSIYGDRGFWRAALRLAIPIALQNLLSASFSLVDTFMVAKLGGTVLSAVGMAGQWSWMQNIAVFGVGSATSLFVAQYWGVQDKEGIWRTTGIAAASAHPDTQLFMLGLSSVYVLFSSHILRFSAALQHAVAERCKCSAICVNSQISDSDFAQKLLTNS